jgi:hypothetical protein
VVPNSQNTNVLEAKPLDANNSVSANPNIPSVSASAVLGESSPCQVDSQMSGTRLFSQMSSEHMLDQAWNPSRQPVFKRQFGIGGRPDPTDAKLAVETCQRKWKRATTRNFSLRVRRNGCELAYFGIRQSNLVQDSEVLQRFLVNTKWSIVLSHYGWRYREEHYQVLAAHLYQFSILNG